MATGQIQPADIFVWPPEYLKKNVNLSPTFKNQAIAQTKTIQISSSSRKMRKSGKPALPCGSNQQELSSGCPWGHVFSGPMAPPAPSLSHRALQPPAYLSFYALGLPGYGRSELEKPKATKGNQSLSLKRKRKLWGSKVIQERMQVGLRLICLLVQSLNVLAPLLESSIPSPSSLEGSLKRGEVVFANSGRPKLKRPDIAGRGDAHL